MAQNKLGEYVYFGDTFINKDDAKLHIASSAVLYGLSIYTVFSVNKTTKGMAVFRLRDHYSRLQDSSKITGIDNFVKTWTYEKFEAVVKELIKINKIQQDTFIRASIHVNEITSGTRARGLNISLSMFSYPAMPIISSRGVRLKTSVWRRVPDNAIPARAKINGAYVNSVLAKQEAIDNGYDDCIFLDANGHVCESSASNIFLIRGGVLLTPELSNDLLEGINRQTIIELAEQEALQVVQRQIDLTELYIADEVFLCGTSALIASVDEIDARKIGDKQIITNKLSKLHHNLLHGNHSLTKKYLTYI